MRDDPNSAITYTAVGTLILAAVTAVLVYLSVKTIRRTGDREQREQSQRRLDDIRKWAEEAIKAAISRQTRDSHELWEAKLRYKYSLATGAYINGIVESFPTLGPLVETVSDQLEHASTVTTQVINKEIENGGAALVECENQLREAGERLLFELPSA